MNPVTLSPLAIGEQILVTGRVMALGSMAVAIVAAYLYLALRRKTGGTKQSVPVPSPASVSFSIDPDCGSLIFEPGNVFLTRLSHWRAIPESFSALLGPDRDMRTGWIWRSLSPVIYQGHSVALALGYHNDRLEMIDFSLLRATAGWPTQEESMEEVKILRAAIEAQLATTLDSTGTRKFPWGGVYCMFDPRSGATSAGINYRSGLSSHLL